MSTIRLNKFLAERGICSRRKADEMISSGLVKVNKKIVQELGVKIDEEKDIVEVDGKIIGKKDEDLIYIALNKPVGYICTCQKNRYEKNVITDLVKIPQRVFPIGRLDKDSSGLILLTNDGDLAYKLTHPKFECEKEYEVMLGDDITEGAIKKLEAGVSLFGQKTNPTKITRITANKFRIILNEGKNRQIRRICRKVGYDVVDLKRIREGNVVLGGLKEGEWRRITKPELL